MWKYFWSDCLSLSASETLLRPYQLFVAQENMDWLIIKAMRWVNIAVCYLYCSQLQLISNPEIVSKVCTSSSGRSPLMCRHTPWACIRRKGSASIRPQLGLYREEVLHQRSTRTLMQSQIWYVESFWHSESYFFYCWNFGSMVQYLACHFLCYTYFLYHFLRTVKWLPCCLSSLFTMFVI